MNGSAVAKSDFPPADAASLLSAVATGQTHRVVQEGRPSLSPNLPRGIRPKLVVLCQLVDPLRTKDTERKKTTKTNYGRKDEKDRRTGLMILQDPT
jgi:hypothetical protein